MRRILSILLVCAGLWAEAQEEAEQEAMAASFERMAETEEVLSVDDDGRMALWEEYRRHPIDLNRTDPRSWGPSLGLTALQVEALVAYRRLLGALLAVEELQAVPGWDPATVRRVLPYVRVVFEPRLTAALSERVRKGEHQLLIRTAIRSGFEGGYGLPEADPDAFRGDRSQWLVRYRYGFRNLLRWGLTGEKDAGEPFLRKGGMPFDFRSGFVALQDFRSLKALVVGDFQVNMGQGLVHWQGLAFGKGAEVLQAYRQSELLRPHGGTDENRFHRGLGVTFRRRLLEATAFVGLDRLDANLVRDPWDSVPAYASSLLLSGLHRSAREWEDRDALRQQVVGGRVHLSAGRFRVSLNTIHYRFNLPIRKDPRPDNLFSISGRHWSNQSLDYAWSLGNLLLYGEAAVDRRGRFAVVQGVMASLHPDVDLSLLYRGISRGYRAMGAHAFTEQTEPMNERGFFAGVGVRPASGWRVDAFADLFRLPWLSYSADRPSVGSQYQLQVSWRPAKRTELLLRWQRTVREGNMAGSYPGMTQTGVVERSGIRFQFLLPVSADLSIRGRTELVRHGGAADPGEGFLQYLDGVWRPMGSPWRVTLRLAYFDTEGYASRVYAYENDVPFYNVVSAFQGSGHRSYLILGRKLGRDWQCYLKLARTGSFMTGGEAASAGGASGRAEIRFQLVWRGASG